MNTPWPQSWIAALLMVVLAALAAPVLADPPARVMQLSHASGSVSFQPYPSDDWLRATPNRPLVPGDALWVDEGARAELRTTGAALRLREHTSVALLNLDDRTAQLRLSQGTLILSVRRLGAGQVIEIDTPNLAFRPDRPGLYRIDVAPDGEWTEVTTRRGAAAPLVTAAPSCWRRAAACASTARTWATTSASRWRRSTSSTAGAWSATGAGHARWRRATSRRT